MSDTKKLVAFFRSAEGDELGRDGDYDNLCPADTAIRAIRDLRRRLAEAINEVAQIGFKLGVRDGQLASEKLRVEAAERTIKHWKDLAAANRKVAEDAQSERNFYKRIANIRNEHIKRMAAQLDAAARKK